MTTKGRKVIEAHEFHLVDESGRLCGILATLKSGGSPALKFFDEKQHDRLSIGLEKDGAAHVSCLNSKGQVVVGLGLGADGRCGLTVADADGQLAALVVVHPDGARQLHLFNRNGATVDIRDW